MFRFIIFLKGIIFKQLTMTHGKKCYDDMKVAA